MQILFGICASRVLGKAHEKITLKVNNIVLYDHCDDFGCAQKQARRTASMSSDICHELLMIVDSQYKGVKGCTKSRSYYFIELFN